MFADFPGDDPSYPLFAFIFLVAPGIDYNIFLMACMREGARSMPRKEAMLNGPAVTGGVITSAGIVLAGTTFVVRSILVPALTFSIDEKTRWPSRLGRR